MNLTNLAQNSENVPPDLKECLTDSRQLAEESLRVIRDMAMGLRPSMLDDLGLGPALEWQTRDFSRRSGLIINLDLEGTLEDLPDHYRTGIFRIVQESLTNCARHAMAHEVRVVLHRSPDQITLLIQDDGKGFHPDNQTHLGLGLLSIKERIRELQGKILFDSEPEKGTRISIELPNPTEEKNDKADSDLIGR